MKDWRYDLALTRRLESLADTVADWALEMDLLSADVKLGQGWESDDDAKPHQFDLLQTAAEEAECGEVVCAYLRYQIARSGEGTGWRYGGGGKTVLSMIEGNLKTAAEQAANGAAEDVRGNGAQAASDELAYAWILLIRQYVGCLGRRFKQRRRDWDLKKENRDE
jgi:hypothetical protein